MQSAKYYDFIQRFDRFREYYPDLNNNISQMKQTILTMANFFEEKGLWNKPSLCIPRLTIPDVAKTGYVASVLRLSHDGLEAPILTDAQKYYDFIVAWDEYNEERFAKAKYGMSECARYRDLIEIIVKCFKSDE